jgi:hypothetical protein
MSRIVEGKVGIDAALGLVRHFMDSPPGTDVEMRFAEDLNEGRSPTLVVTCGDRHFGFTAYEADITADIITSAIQEFGDTCDLSSLAVAMRQGAKLLRERFGTDA